MSVASRSSPARLSALLVTALFSAAALAQPAPLVVVQYAERAQQTAQGAVPQILSAPMPVRQQDRLSTQAGGRLDLSISRHGFIELGGDSVLTVERLPFSTFDVDLHTHFRVERGYFRLVWKHADFAARWPMVMDVGPFRVNATSGEYFIEHDPQRTLLCVAEGEVAINTPGQPEAAVLSASACYRLLSGAPAQVAAVAPEQFMTVRGERKLLPLSVVLGLAGGEVETAAAEPVPPPVAALPSVSAVPSPTASLQAERDRAIRSAAVGPATVTATAAPPRVTTPPTPRPSPAPPTRPPTPTSEVVAGWSLNVASLTTREAAEKVRQPLIGAGFLPEIVIATVEGRQWYRVQFRGLASAGEARELAARLERETGVKGAWVVPPSR